MKQEATFFDNREAVLIYIAKKLRDAMRAGVSRFKRRRGDKWLATSFNERSPQWRVCAPQSFELKQRRLRAIRRLMKTMRSSSGDRFYYNPRQVVFIPRQHPPALSTTA